MRKIEQAMIAALTTCTSWRGGNTTVTPQGGRSAQVSLHGHHIATVEYDPNDGALRAAQLRVCLAGWNTQTTRSRLSAIIRTFALNGGQGLGVGTKAGIPWLYDANGKRPIDSTSWHRVALHTV